MNDAGDACETIASLISQKEEAYHERNEIVAALAKLAGAVGGRCWLWRHDGPDWDDDWRTITYIWLPETGQMSWHIHDSEVRNFRFADWGCGKWDGHTKEQKYARLKTLRVFPQVIAAAPKPEKCELTPEQREAIRFAIEAIDIAYRIPDEAESRAREVLRAMLGYEGAE